MYKNPTDFFVHVTADKSAAAKLAGQFALQVSLPACEPRTLTFTSSVYASVITNHRLVKAVNHR